MTNKCEVVDVTGKCTLYNKYCDEVEDCFPKSLHRTRERLLSELSFERTKRKSLQADLEELKDKIRVYCEAEIEYAVNHREPHTLATTLLELIDKY